MKLIKLFIILSACLTLFSCSESFLDISTRHQIEYNQLKKDIAEFADIISEKREIITPTSPLNPKPNFYYYSSESNVLILAVEQLKQFEKKTDWTKTVDIESNWLGTLERYNTSTDSPGDSTSATFLTNKFEDYLIAAVQARYVVAIEPIIYRLPKMIDEKTFDPGAIGIYVTLYDREKKSILVAFKTIAKPGVIVHISDQDGYSQINDLQGKLYRDLVYVVKDKVFKKLEELTGGSFKQL